MVNFKILILGPTILPHILIFCFILVPLFPLFHLFSFEKCEVWVASEKHRYFKLATPMEILAKYSQFPNYTLAEQSKIMPLELL